MAPPTPANAVIIDSAPTRNEPSHHDLTEAVRQKDSPRIALKLLPESASERPPPLGPR
jgi:hypothetical protein